jgi:hypothetical protein
VHEKGARFADACPVHETVGAPAYRARHTVKICPEMARNCPAPCQLSLHGPWGTCAAHRAMLIDHSDSNSVMLRMMHAQQEGARCAVQCCMSCRQAHLRSAGGKGTVETCWHQCAAATCWRTRQATRLQLSLDSAAVCRLSICMHARPANLGCLGPKMRAARVSTAKCCRFNMLQSRDALGRDAP